MTLSYRNPIHFVLFLTFVGVSLFALLYSRSAPAAPTVTWTPSSLTAMIKTGENSSVSAAFVASNNASNVTVRVVPALAPYVKVTPTSFPTVTKGAQYTLTVTFSIPADAPLGAYDGTIHLQQQGSKTLAKPLPLTLTIEQGTASFSTPPDPDKVIMDSQGMIYPVNQLIIHLKDGYTRSDADEIASSIHSKIIGVMPYGNLYQLEVPSNTTQELDVITAALKTDTRIDAVMKNVEPQLHSTRTDLDNLRNYDAELTRAYDKLNLSNAWNLISQSGKPLHPVTIAIIDTGMDGSHLEFEHVNKEGDLVEHGYSGKCGSTTSHGTQVAGIIGANNLSSMAPRVVLPPDSPQMNGILSGVPGLKYTLLMNPAGYLAKDLDQINVAIKHKATIINYSRGSTLCDHLSADKQQCGCISKDEYTEQYMAFISMLSGEEASRLLFVAAVGNEDVPATDNLPGGGLLFFDNVISVGATTTTDGRADFSNFGASVDVSAPGEGVYAPGLFVDPLDRNDYLHKVNTLTSCELRDYFKGTSASAPMVTGVAGLLKAIKPELTPKEIKDILVETGQKFSTDKPIGPRVDAAAAVRYVLNPYQVVVVNFDDVNTAPLGYSAMPNAYAGLSWSSDWSVMSDSYYSSIYHNTYGSPSGQNSAYNGYGTLTVSVSDNSPFAFRGASFAGWGYFNAVDPTRSATSITVEGYRQGQFVGSKTMGLSSSGYQWLQADLQGVDEIRFISSDNQRWWLMDDLTIEIESTSTGNGSW